MELKVEVWKPIEGFEGRYEISNLGRVKSLTRTIWFKDGKNRNGGKRIAYGKILTTRAFGKGRPRANLRRGNGCEWYYVHRLVAMAFCDGYREGLVVNHKDGNIYNNRADNLEWCTQSYNIKHSYFDGKRKGEYIGKVKAIKQFTLQGEYIKTFDSINEAARITNIPATNICAVCKGKRSKTGGYKWSYE